MTHEQVRKLLGGYATNSLTESERRALYDAALDDQELFNALQDEQALKDLLADPLSRAQVQRALMTQPAHARVPFWSRPWTWGGVVGAVAASVLILAVIRSSPSNQQLAVKMKAPIPPPVLTQAAPKLDEPAARKPRQAAREFRQAAPSTPGAFGTPAVPSTSGVSSTTTASSAPSPSVANSISLRSEAARKAPPPAAAAPSPPPPSPVAAQEAAGLRMLPSAGLPGAVGGALAGVNQPFLRYSLVRPDGSGITGGDMKAGDGVRLNVFSPVAGSLSLDQLAASGEWKRLYPDTEPGLLVTAGAARIIPDAPIVVAENEQRLRLTLIPLAVTDQLAKKTSPPVVVELTIAAKKAP